MKGHSSRCAYLFVCLIAFFMFHGVRASADSIVSDGTFSNSNWTLDTLSYTGPTPSASATQETSGGDPGDFRQLTMTYGGDGNIYTGSVYNAYTYDPATQGAIETLDYTYDLELINGGDSNIVGYGVLVEQDGQFYVAGASSTPVYPNTDEWASRNSGLLTATDFTDILNPSEHPNFSSSGDPIEFGYYADNGTEDAGQSTTVSGIDNWEVDIQSTPTPEPPSLLTLASGVALLALTQLLRRSQ
jgi:hypothetical protein